MFNKNFAYDWIRTADFWCRSDRSTNWATTTAHYISIVTVRLNLFAISTHCWQWTGHQFLLSNRGIDWGLQKGVFFQDYSPKTVPWPQWVSNITNLSHFLLTCACSGNFFIYFGMHSQNFRIMVQMPIRRLWYKLGQSPIHDRQVPTP